MQPLRTTSLLSFEVMHLTLLSSFFFNDTATTEIYTLSLHDALPILPAGGDQDRRLQRLRLQRIRQVHLHQSRSEEHTSELQSPDHLVCRLLLEKKKETEHTLAPIMLPPIR